MVTLSLQKYDSLPNILVGRCVQALAAMQTDPESDHFSYFESASMKEADFSIMAKLSRYP